MLDQLDEGMVRFLLSNLVVAVAAYFMFRRKKGPHPPKPPPHALLSSMSERELLELDDASRAFAARLFARFPDWRGLAMVEPPGQAIGDPRGVRVDLASPTHDPDRTLTIFMHEGEPSVAFGDWHSHLSMWEDEAAFFSFLEEVLVDRQLFVAWAPPTENIQPIEQPTEERIAEILTGEDAPGELRVLSWSGKADRTVRLSDLAIDQPPES